MILFRWINHKQEIKTKMVEKEFVDVFIDDKAVNYLFSGSYIVIREFKSTSGVPDVILLNRRHIDKLIKFRQKYSGVNLSKSHARIITNLSKRAYYPSAHLSKITGYSLSYTRMLLEQLDKAGIVVKKDKKWKLVGEFVFPNVETISLEFKLADWQSALKQGYRYKRLATRSYIVMPSNKSQLLQKNKQRFAGLDVGAVVYSRETKKAEIIAKPSRSKPTNSSYLGSLSSLSDFAFSAV